MATNDMTMGSALAEWYLQLSSALSTLGTLGAGFTLGVVVQGSHEHNAAGFNPSTVNTWAAISSILFVLTVLVAQGCGQLFRFETATIAEGIDGDDHFIKGTLAAVSLILQTQVLGAFVFLELVVTAHSPWVGWVGIAITSILGIVALALWSLQATGRKPVRYIRIAAKKRGKGNVPDGLV